MEMDFHCSAGNSGDARICCHWRRNSATPVELAAAAALRLAPDHLLASAWTSDAVPDSLRRTGRARFRSLQFPPSHERALRAHDARRAGTIPATHARTLRLRPIYKREQGAMRPSRQRPPGLVGNRARGVISSVFCAACTFAFIVFPNFANVVN